MSFESCGTLGMVPAFLSLCALSAEGALAQSPLPRLVGKVACVQCTLGAWSHVGSVPGERAGGGALVGTAHGGGGGKHGPLPGRRELLLPPPVSSCPTLQVSNQSWSFSAAPWPGFINGFSLL